MNTLSNGDKAYIAFLTGNSCHAHVWTLLSIYGADKMYGGTGAPTHLSPEEQDEWLEMWELQYADPRWKELRDRMVNENKCCAKCGNTQQLEVHHTVYHRDKLLWEYEDTSLQVLCKKCHLGEHGLTIRSDGSIDKIDS